MAKLSERAQEAAGLPAQKTGGGVVAMKPAPSFMDEYETEAGRGSSSAAEDNTTPLIYILTSNSPQVDTNLESYVHGATPGCWWLKNAPEGCEIVPGDVGIQFQHCYVKRNVVEWVPRDKGGGFVAVHDVRQPSDVPGARLLDKNDPYSWVNDAGDHDLVDTLNHVGIVRINGLYLPYAFPSTSTKLKPSRDWISMQQRQKYPSGVIRDAWCKWYTLRTVPKKNDYGRWYIFEARDPDDWASKVEFEMGKQLYLQFETGELKVAVADQETGHDPNTGEVAGERARETI